MRTILLVKTSSLGDVVHNLPVVADIRGALGEVAIDWAVEKAFAAIPAMHAGVRRVIACELRRWRRTWLRRDTREDWRAFVGALRAERYDAVIDTQGLLKSALLSRVASGFRVGLDWRSSREPLRLFYDRVFDVPWSLHAVERNRTLAARALGYRFSGDPRYGIAAEPSAAPWLPAGPYFVLLHATSHPRKLWPAERWSELGAQMSGAGIKAVLPWGNAAEHARARALHQALPGSCLAPALDIAELARVIAGARCVVGVDTGLTHLAAALGIPVIGIYGGTDPKATGVHAAGRVANLGGLGRFPAVDDVAAALRGFGLVP